MTRRVPFQKTPFLFILGLVLGPIALSFADENHNLVERGASVQKLADGFRFTEGPAVDAEGNVYFSDIPNNRIHRWSLDGKLATVREQSGGANGLFFDRHGNLLACEGKARRVTSMTPKGKISVLADSFDGKKLNSPNDLWIDKVGGVYFTDPRYGSMDGLEQGGFHVYYRSAGGKVSRVLDNLVKPNGVIGTRDNRFLYVADPGAKKTYRFTIDGPGKLTDRKLAAESGSDGMTLDKAGNLYLTSGAVLVFDSNAKQIATIEVPERPSNVCFGGKDSKTLFITARTGFYSLAMRVGGQ